MPKSCWMRQLIRLFERTALKKSARSGALSRRIQQVEILTRDYGSARQPRGQWYAVVRVRQPGGEHLATARRKGISPEQEVTPAWRSTYKGAPGAFQTHCTESIHQLTPGGSGFRLPRLPTWRSQTPRQSRQPACDEVVRIPDRSF
jgi:hypothetical protein